MVRSSGLYYKSFTIAMTLQDNMGSTVKLNHDDKALSRSSITAASVVNYDCKCEATIWGVHYDHNLQL